MKTKPIFFFALSLFILSSLSVSSQKVELSGIWEGPTLVEGAGIELILTLVVEMDGDEIKGKINDDQGFIDCEITEPKLEGNAFTFMAVANTPDGDYDMVFNIKIDGKSMTGTWESGGMIGEWTAEKK